MHIDTRERLENRFRPTFFPYDRPPARHSHKRLYCPAAHYLQTTSSPALPHVLEYVIRDGGIRRLLLRVAVYLGNFFTLCLQYKQ